MPLMTIYVQIILAISFEQGQDDELLGTIAPTINTIGVLFLWFKCVYYLRIWESTNYLASMVVKVMIGMRWFLIIFLMSNLAFG